MVVVFQIQKPPSSFDALDDLNLVKNYVTKTITEVDPNTHQEYDVEVIDTEKSLPMLIDKDGFYDPSRDAGFLLGCMKFEVLAWEKTDAEVEQLRDQVANLQQQINQLTQNRGD